MKVNQPVVDAMNGLLAAELSAIDQYSSHSKMHEDWDLVKLHERITHKFDDENGLASALIERILFLDGMPDMVTRESINGQ